MTIFLALLVDAYRELNSRKLFWIVLLLSFLFVAVYASIGFDETGMFILFGLKHFDSELLTEGSPMAKLLYRGIFATFVVPIWLAWVATILALISTAPIFPEFVASGSIDLVLCKPISRIRLFISKYLASLLFVLLQVSVFCVGVFLAIGWRLNDWEWKVFLAVPLVTLFYSYLYSFCVLVGVWTRSTLAALLLTMLMWFGIYALTATEGIVMLIRTQLELQVEDGERRQARAERNAAPPSTAPSTTPNVVADPAEAERTKQRETIADLNHWLEIVRTMRWPLPKTSETVDLLSRNLSREGDINLMDLMQGNVAIGPDDRPMKLRTDRRDQIAQERIIKETERSNAFIIGTSVGFELVVLALACAIFVRRDY